MVTEMPADEVMQVDNPEPTEAKPDAGDLLTLEDLKDQIKQIEKSVSLKEPRFTLRVLRSLGGTRKKLNATVLRRAINYFFASNAIEKMELLRFIETVEDDQAQSKTLGIKKGALTILPETKVYLHLLVLLHLLDLNKNQTAQECSELLMSKLTAQNRRTLDLLAARCYYYHSRVYEINGKLGGIRSFLLGRLRTATLCNDHEGQAALITCLLRNYLNDSLYDQADKLVSKSTFPETSSNNEWARFLYYTGRIKAMQLEYSEAHKFVQQAIRKAPQYSAFGFWQAAHKLVVVVELLLGDIPDRTLFRQPNLRRSLQPYFQLTQAVRSGSLDLFNKVVDANAARFQADHTYMLIVRLRHNVIKTAVRMMTQSYSCISLQDAAIKLQLDGPEDAEFIIAKAIRDGVIEAQIDHDQGWVKSKDTGDIYSTREPQMAFNQRIGFCLDIHNQSVKAMRFPPKSYNKDMEESAEERREREQQDLEYAKEMADEDDDFP